MADKIKGSVCLNHPNTPAVAHCAVCRKPVCKECVKIFDGTSFCSRECYEKSLKTGKMVEDVIEKRDTIARNRMIRNVIVIIVIAALAFGGYKYYKANKAKVDAQLRKAKMQTEQKVQQTKKEIDQSKKAIGDGLIKDSKYKKQREGWVE
ncbi:MAG: hypothetical protein J5833_02460 [Victivallales bacterium]|nr:hypothetical protein [Victivallales bacterium]